MRSALALIAFSSIAGCGVVYVSPSVNPIAADSEVEVVPMTAQTVAAENQTNSYTPRHLPAAFSMTAGTTGSASANPPLPDTYLSEQSAMRPQTRLPPPTTTPTYRIGVGDVVVLATRQAGSTVEELTGLLAAQNRRQGYTVQDDGALAIPDVGRVKVAGMTVEEAEEAVFQRLVERQIDPSFSLEIAEFNSKRVTIGGAIAKPAALPITLLPLTLGEAVAAAGGVKVPDLDYGSIRLSRDGSLYQIPLTEFYADQSLQQIQLLDGDSIFVDTTFELDQAAAFFSQQVQISNLQRQDQAAALNRLNAEIGLQRAELEEQRRNFERLTALEAVERDYVYLAGEVTRQGRFPLPFDTRASLADAMFGGGGFPNNTGNPRQVYVLRSQADGTIRALHLNLANAANLALTPRLLMKPDDIIFIAEQPITRWNRVVQQIVPSLITTTAGIVAN